MKRVIVLVLGLGLLAAACASTPTGQAQPSEALEPTTSPSPATTEAPTTTTPATSTSTSVSLRALPAVSVTTGAQKLVDSNFSQLSGSRVGLIAHQNSVVHIDGEQVHLSDAMVASGVVELVSLFGPEHGVRGSADAGELVDDEIDANTGLPVFSLFGNTRQPSQEMLEDLDVLVYDLQDVGTRYYTYISTMGLAMQAAAEADVGFIVLDRPNPLGGGIGGGVLEPGRASFVGQYPIPDRYGLTAGELAKQIIEQRWLSGLDDLDFEVITLDGWTRDQLWSDTGLEWIAPSPALDTVESALVYPATIWFEASAMSYGRGTSEPFRVLGAPWLDAEAAVAELRSRSLPGVDFETTQVTPTMLPGFTVEPAFVDQTIPAVRLRVDDSSAVDSTALGVHLLEVMSIQALDAGATFLSRPAWLDQLSGNTLLRTAIESGEFDVSRVLADQQTQRAGSESQVSAALLYE